MNTFTPFPSFVTETDLSNKFNSQEFLNFIKGDTNLQDHGLVKKGLSTFNSQNYILDILVFSDLKQIIQNNISTYCKNIDIREPRITNSWYNIMGEDSKVEFHIHEGSTISGVYYPLLEEENCKLIFKSPNPSINLIPKLTDKGPYSQLKYFIVPIKQNHLYLFPSYLEHGTLENQGGTRIALSFNTTVE